MSETRQALLPWGVAIGAVLLATASSQADPVGWAYQASVETTINLWAGSVGPTQPGHGTIYNYGVSGYRNVGVVLGGAERAERAGDATVQASAVSWFYGLHPTDSWYGDSFGLDSLSDYALKFVLEDLDSGASGELTFTGSLGGSWVGLDSAFLTNTFLGPTSGSLVLGGNRYAVEVFPFLAPLDSGGNNPTLVSLEARVSVVPADVPEPATLALACVGLLGVGGASAWRRRRLLEVTT